jgi:hypothetical protein
MQSKLSHRYFRTTTLDENDVPSTRAIRNVA